MKRKAFTLVELLVVVAIIALLLGILLPALGRAREIANRAVCGANVRGMYQAMYTYSVTNQDKFPIAGIATSGNSVVGFSYTTRATVAVTTVNATSLANNASASLWLMIRDGSENVKAFTCPSSGDTKDPMTTTIGGTVAASMSGTFDFQERKNLSYSALNMYHLTTGAKWGSSVGGDWVVMGDNNNASTGSHGNEKASSPSTDTIRKEENSQNHASGEGQNLLFGDGHVNFANTPFEGPSNDNVNAGASNATGTETAVAPELLNNAANSSSSQNTGNNVVLIPVGGVSASLAGS